VKRKARPLTLNIKGEGYKIHHKVFAGEPKVEVSSPGQIEKAQPFPLDFGEFFINERKVRKITLQNNGNFSFHFSWKAKFQSAIRIVPDSGTVEKETEKEIEIIYNPPNEHTLKNHKCTLNIVSGPKYEFNLNGVARKPGVKCNATVFDFGQCFVTGQPSALTKELIMENFDTQALSIESDFVKTNYLDVPLTPGQVLMPDKGDNVLNVPILFTPRECRKYEEKVRLDFNNLYQVDILVKAQGIPLNLDLRDPDQAITDLGIVSVGGSASRTIPILNKSQKAVKFKLRPSNPAAFAAAAMSMSVDSNATNTLKPKEVLNVTVRFNPKARLPPFSCEVIMEVEGVEEDRVLFSVTGVAHGIELKLMENTLAFGNVVKDSMLTKTMQMSNFGDVKAKYTWDAKAFGKNFTITPASGYVNPNANMDVEITFHPSTVDNNLQANVTAEV
jgi:hydrocephalus-inducing protein